ncbi:MAG: O-methyltransferase [bacterium]
MFHDIPVEIRRRMRYLERLDAVQRTMDVSDEERLKQIPPATGKFISLLAASSPEGIMLEIGTSAGYSTLWLATVCKRLGRKLVTIERLESKIKVASETIEKAKINDVVELVHGDARDLVSLYKDVSFCFLDIDKRYYLETYELVVPNMVSGGLLVADNISSHRALLGRFVRRVFRDRRVDAIVVPIGSGELICRKV